jgi:hypothetical protein
MNKLVYAALALAVVGGCTQYSESLGSSSQKLECTSNLSCEFQEPSTPEEACQATADDACFWYCNVTEQLVQSVEFCSTTPDGENLVAGYLCTCAL